MRLLIKTEAFENAPQSGEDGGLSFCCALTLTNNYTFACSIAGAIEENARKTTKGPKKKRGNADSYFGIHSLFPSVDADLI